MIVRDVFIVQKYKKINAQIILDEPNNMFKDDLFIVQPVESTTKEEHFEIKELIMIEENESMTFDEDKIRVQSSNITNFVIKIDDGIALFLVEFKLSILRKSNHIQNGKVRFWRTW